MLRSEFTWFYLLGGHFEPGQQYERSVAEMDRGGFQPFLSHQIAVEVERNQRAIMIRNGIGRAAKSSRQLSYLPSSSAFDAARSQAHRRSLSHLSGGAMPLDMSSWMYGTYGTYGSYGAVPPSPPWPPFPQTSQADWEAQCCSDGGRRLEQQSPWGGFNRAMKHVIERYKAKQRAL